MDNIIIDLQKSGTWKIQLTIAITFIYYKDTDEEQTMHTKSDTIEVMIIQIELLRNSLICFFLNIKFV